MSQLLTNMKIIDKMFTFSFFYIQYIFWTEQATFHVLNNHMGLLTILLDSKELCNNSDYYFNDWFYNKMYSSLFIQLYFHYTKHVI